MTNKKNSSAIQRRLIPTYIFLIIVSFISVFPLYWMIAAATNRSVDVARGKITFGSYALENFQNLTSQTDLWGALGNSFLYAIVQTVVALFICSLAGFGFELYHDKGKDKVFSILLLAMMIPQVATMIPLFKMISSAGLLNTVWAFILPSISTPFLIMMFRQNSRNFPIDIMEAARLDGLSEFQIYFRMYMPVMKSTYAAAAVITFMNAWNHANVDRQPGKWIHNRLWNAYDGRIVLLHPNHDHLLRIAEAVRRRYHRFCKISLASHTCYDV